jgi:hypothetical protein
MSKFVFSSLDDYDSRREVWRQLHSLSPADRVVVLRHFCDAVASGDGGVKPKRSMLESVWNAYRSDAWDRRLTSEIYCDLWLLVTQYGLDPVRFAVVLEGWARRPTTIPPVVRRRPGPAASPVAPSGGPLRT